MKNKNQKIAVFISVLTISFFFLFGHFMSMFLDNPQSDKKDSYLSFVDMSLGSGQQAENGQKVTINFVLKTTSGETIASSLYSGPISFVLGSGQSMAGLENAVLGMKVNGKRVVVIPPMYVYAYDNSGQPVTSDVPLVFEVELVSVN